MNFSFPFAAAVVVAALMALTGCGSNRPNPLPKIVGTLNYPGFVVTPGCNVDVRLDDVTVPDAPPTTLAHETINPRESSPLPFELHYDPKTLVPDHRYVVTARINCGAELVLIADPVVPVLTQGNPTTASVTMKRATK